MTTAPYALLRVALDGGAAASGAIVASGGNACQLSADPGGTAGVSAYLYEIYEYPAGFPTPAGWTLDGTTGVISYAAGPTPPSFTLPTVVSNWGKFLFRLTVNNGDPGPNPSIPKEQLKSEGTVVKVPHWSGVEDIGHLEGNQFDAIRAWAAAGKNNIRFLAALASAVHAQVRLATAAALPAYTRVGDVLTANANGALTAVDSVGPAVGDRILLKNGALNSDNGIYVVTSLGSGGTPWVLTRAFDMCIGTTPRAMMMGAIEEGVTNGGKQWKLTTNNPIILNTTALAFTVF